MALGPLTLSGIISDVRIAKTFLEKSELKNPNIVAAIARLETVIARLRVGRDEALDTAQAQRNWRDRGNRHLPSPPPAAA